MPEQIQDRGEGGGIASAARLNRCFFCSIRDGCFAKSLIIRLLGSSFFFCFLRFFLDICLILRYNLVKSSGIILLIGITGGRYAFPKGRMDDDSHFFWGG